MMDAAGIQERASRSPFTAILGLTVRSLDDAALTMRMAMRPELRRSEEGDQFHGGAVATMVDVVGVYAVAAVLGVPTPTVHLAVDFLQPGVGEWLDATATVRRKGRALSTVDVEVVRPDGKLVALGRAIYMNP